MSRSKPKYSLKLAGVLLLYLALAITYSVVVPIGRGADEWAHYWYAGFITEHGRLPANPTEREVAGYKSDWPPLYHLLAAGVTGWVDTDGPPAFKYRQDNLRRQLVPAQGPEAILHTEDELFPWRQEILVWHLGRFLSISLTLGTLVVTYWIAREIFRPPAQAVFVAACLAFIPRFLFTGMLFNYDSLNLLLTTLFLWLLIRVAKGYYPCWGFWGLGALAGLALMTKYLAAFLPLEILAAALLVPTSGAGGASLQFVLSWRRVTRLLQAGLAFTATTAWWFGYLLVNFNEIETYGPLLGSVAPLLRGDGSDRTVEKIFAFLSGGAAPPPAHIEQQFYSPWQILAEFPITLWGIPSSRPYPLNWFIVVMTVIALVAIVGLVLAWRRTPDQRPWLGLLALHCMLPLPFMVIRLFGARDALEAVQGRHILFMAGPALVILLVWGLVTLAGSVPSRPLPRLRFAFYALPALLLVASLQQLLFMGQVYPLLLPVRTTPPGPLPAAQPLPQPIRLEGGAELVVFNLGHPCTAWCRVGELFPAAARFLPVRTDVLRVALTWQAGPRPAPEDYRVELALMDNQGQSWSDWLAYQTQARYPTRAWEPGDTIRDEGWLPLSGLPPGEYKLRLRISGENGEVTGWQMLTSVTVEPHGPGWGGWRLWQQGRPVAGSPVFRERETVQVTFGFDPAVPSSPPTLVGPAGVAYAPASAGPTWANFIVGPDWPPGDYQVFGGGPRLRIADNQRMFLAPAVSHPLEVNFEGQLRLLGYDLPTRRVEPGGGLPLVLYWQGQRWMNEDFVIFSRLLDNRQGESAAVWGGYDRLAKENYSTLFWAPGEIVVDGFAVPVAVETPDGIYKLNLGWYRRANGEAVSLVILDPATGQASGATSVSLGPIKVGGPPPGVVIPQARPRVTLDVLLGEQVKLLGFDLEHCPGPETGCNLERPNLELTFYWQALAAMATDYTVFVHLRNEAGAIVAQKDGPPAAGAYPTSLWDGGEIIQDRMSLPLPAPLPPGRYELVAGMYDFASGMRLPVVGSPDGTVLLWSFEVDE